MQRACPLLSFHPKCPLLMMDLIFFHRLAEEVLLVMLKKCVFEAMCGRVHSLSRVGLPLKINFFLREKALTTSFSKSVVGQRPKIKNQNQRSQTHEAKGAKQP
jgi:hypothetical protein